MNINLDQEMAEKRSLKMKKFADDIRADYMTVQSKSLANNAMRTSSPSEQQDFSNTLI